ncbi:MAG: hypothetical protein AB7G48_10390 [Nitrospiraceae bacterium]
MINSLTFGSVRSSAASISQREAAEVTKEVGFEVGQHDKRNIRTSGTVGDERKDGHETVWLGEINARYRLSPRWNALVAFQRSQRRESFEQGIVHNTNVTAGATCQF